MLKSQKICFWFCLRSTYGPLFGYGNFLLSCSFGTLCDSKFEAESSPNDGTTRPGTLINSCFSALSGSFIGQSLWKIRRASFFSSKPKPELIRASCCVEPKNNRISVAYQLVHPRPRCQIVGLPTSPISTQVAFATEILDQKLF